MPLSTPLRRALRTQRHRDKGRCVAPRVRCGETLCGHNGTPDLEVHREVECWCFRPLVTPALALARGQAHRLVVEVCSNQSKRINAFHVAKNSANIFFKSGLASLDS